MRLKAKQNDNPNNLQKNRKDGVKTRNQTKAFKNTRKLSAQTSACNSVKKSKSLQKIEPKYSKDSLKQIRSFKQNIEAQPIRRPHDPAQDYYQQILAHTKKMNQDKAKLQGRLILDRTYIKIRHVLIQSMYKNFCKFNLRRKTMFLFVRYLDAFVLKNGYQGQNIIVQCYASFLMALKYEEIYPPSITEWISQDLHQRVYAAQGKLLQKLNFNVIYDSVQYYFEYFSLQVYKQQFTQLKIKNCQHILDMLLFHPEVLQFYKPEILAQVIVKMELNLHTNDQNMNFNNNNDKKYQLESRQFQQVRRTIGKLIFNDHYRIIWIKQAQKQRKT